MCWGHDSLHLWRSINLYIRKSGFHCLQILWKFHRICYQFSSVQSLSVSDSLLPHESQQARPPSPSLTPGAYWNSCPSSRWCHAAISCPVVPYSSWPQSFPASGSFPMRQLFASGGQSTGITIRRWNVDSNKSICMSQTLKSVRFKRDHLNNFVKQHFA